MSFAGVALVALGSGGELSGDLGGVLLGVITAATWAAYSLLVVPLMRRHSATHVSAVVLGLASVPITLTAIPQLRDAGLGPRRDGLAPLRLRVPRPARRHERALVQGARPDRRGTGDARREPPALPRRRDRASSSSPRRSAPVQLAGGVLIAVGILAARRRRGPAAPGE